MKIGKSKDRSRIRRPPGQTVFSGIDRPWKNPVLIGIEQPFNIEGAPEGDESLVSPMP